MGFTYHDKVNLQCVFWESSLVVIGLEQLAAMDVAGASVNAGLMSRVGFAAKVERGKDQL